MGCLSLSLTNIQPDVQVSSQNENDITLAVVEKNDIALTTSDVNTTPTILIQRKGVIALSAGLVCQTSLGYEFIRVDEGRLMVINGYLKVKRDVGLQS